MPAGAQVVSVSRSPRHHFSKPPCDAITLLAGLGVEGDAHAGVTVKHRSRVRVDPTQPNLRQVHLIGAELFDQLAPQGFALGPGDLGENVLTSGIDLLGLPQGTVLHLGETARIAVTGLRNPCSQIEDFRTGLLAQVVGKDDAGQVVRKAGVMAIVLAGGPVVPGDAITVTLPPAPHRPLERI